MLHLSEVHKSKEKREKCLCRKETDYTSAVEKGVPWLTEMTDSKHRGGKEMGAPKSTDSRQFKSGSTVPKAMVKNPAKEFVLFLHLKECETLSSEQTQKKTHRKA